MPDWSDVVARARGLSTHLLGRDRLVEVARAHDLALASDLLARAGYAEIADDAREDPVALERHTRRVAAARLAVIAQWSAGRLHLLAPLYEDEDRRSLTTIVRGIRAGVPIDQRLSGLVPTPSLSEALMGELARQSSVSQVAALLVVWKNAYGPALLAEASRPHPDAFRLQLAIDRRYAERAQDAAESAGGPMLRYVSFQIDLENAWSAMALAAREIEHEAAELFLPGGTSLDEIGFLAAAEQRTSEMARARLIRLTRGTPVSRVLQAAPARWEQEDRALLETLKLLRRETRLDPLSVGAIVQYALRLRAEVRDLARIIWGIALHMPRPLLAQSLVTV